MAEEPSLPSPKNVICKVSQNNNIQNNGRKCITIVKGLQLFGELSGDRKRVAWVHHEVRKPDPRCNFHNPFFNDLHTSIRLLRLKGLKPSFSNIYSQIECLTDRYFLLLVILTWQILFLMLPVPQFELIEWRMTEKYCPIAAENEMSIVSIIHGVLALQVLDFLQFYFYNKEMEYRVELSNEQVFGILMFGESLGSCTGPIQEFGDDGFMIWMVGRIVHLFSIGITFSALWQPISTLHGVGKVFPIFGDIFSFGAIKSATDFQEYNDVAGVSALDFGYTNNTAVTSFTFFQSTLQYQSTRETNIRVKAGAFKSRGIARAYY
ncbi:unnamed protein product [Malus baccata var. baccata]